MPSWCYAVVNGYEFDRFVIISKPSTGTETWLWGEIIGRSEKASFHHHCEKYLFLRVSRHRHSSSFERQGEGGQFVTHRRRKNIMECCGAGNWWRHHARYAKINPTIQQPSSSHTPTSDSIHILLIGSVRYILVQSKSFFHFSSWCKELHRSF